MNLAYRFVLLVINVSTVLSLGHEMKLEHSGHSLSKCSNGLLTGVDTIQYTSEIDNTQQKDPVIQIFLKLKIQHEFQRSCVIQIPQYCDKNLDAPCSCVSQNRSGYYQLFTKFKTQTSWSGALIKGELNVDKTSTKSNIETLPSIYDSSLNYAILGNGKTVIDPSDCRITLTGSPVVLLFRCTDNSPSPCTLKISDASTNATLTSGDSAVTYIIHNAVIKHLEFSYSVCGLPRPAHTFKCTIESSTSEKEVGSNFSDADKHLTPVMIIIIALSTILITILICAIILQNCYFRRKLAATKKYHDCKEPLNESLEKELTDFHILFTDLDINKLPHEIRGEDLIEYIKTVGKLTVKVFQDHHHHLRQSAESDSLNSVDAGSVAKTGSGRVGSVTIYRDNCANPIVSSKKRTCGCSNCRNSHMNKKVLGKFKVATSNCMAYDKDENAICKFVFDKDSSEVYELTVDSATTNKGVHTLKCYSCDNILLDKLKRLLKYKDELSHKINCQNKDKDVAYKTALIISHPDGGQKTVRIEKRKKEEQRSKLRSGFIYDTYTCPDSCGAPIIIIGGRDKWCFTEDPVHIEKQRQAYV